MKKLILLTLLLLPCLTTELFAQGWSNWVSFNNNKGVSAAISFLIRRGPDGISYFQTNNTYIFKGGTLFFAFDYTDDKGRAQTQTGMIDLEKSGVDKDPGYWFISNGGSVTNIRVTRIDLPSDEAAGSGPDNSSGAHDGGSSYGSNTGNNHTSQNTGSNVTGVSSSNSSTGSYMQNQIDPSGFYNVNITPLNGQSPATTNTNNNAGNNVTGTTAPSSNSTVGQANIRIIPNRPVNLNSPATNSNTRNLAQDMQGLQQTQAYLNQQQAQLQQSTANVDNAIQDFGNALQNAIAVSPKRKFKEQMAEFETRQLGMFGQMRYWKEAAAEKLGGYEMKSVGESYYLGTPPGKSDNLINFQKAIEWSQKAVANGSKDAIFQLAELYSMRSLNGVHNYLRNLKLSEELFQKVATDTEYGTADYEYANYKLGEAYENGFFFPNYDYDEAVPDYKKAIMYYTKAADKGYITATQRLYVLYRDNKKVKNKSEEGKWEQQYITQLQNSADTGNIEAMQELADRYNPKRKIKKKYRLVVPDETKYQEWSRKHEAAKKASEEQKQYLMNQLQQAAANGDVHAMFKLGEHYDSQRDYAKAQAWYQKAAQAAGGN